MDMIWSFFQCNDTRYLGLTLRYETRYMLVLITLTLPRLSRAASTCSVLHLAVNKPRRHYSN